MQYAHFSETILTLGNNEPKEKDKSSLQLPPDVAVEENERDGEPVLIAFEDDYRF